MTSKTTKLPAESTVAVSNARRGWYRIFPVILGEKWDPAVAETSLAAGDTLVLLEILIPGEDIEEQDLQRLCDVFSFFVQKKLDLILRFSYDFEGKGREKDPSSLSVVERHMRQIFPVLNEFSDHIFVLQGIFLGSWGEMQSSRYLTKENIQKLEKEIKENLSPKIIRSVRKPVHWRMLCTDEKEVFSEKIGLYNDGMFGSETDLGTYAVPGEEREYAWEEVWPPEKEQAFIAQCAKYAPIGGEVIGGASQTADNIVLRLRTEGITYLNRDHDKKELERWKTMDCGADGVWKGHSLYDYVEAHLGYCFVLRKGSLRKKFHRSIVTLEIENTGFAVSYKEIYMNLEKLSNKKWQCVVRQPLAYLEPGKIQKCKMVCEEDLFSGNWKLTMHDEKGNPVLFANEGAEEGISLSVLH